MQVKRQSRKGVWLGFLSKKMQLAQSRCPRNVWVPTHLLFSKASGTQDLFQCCWKLHVFIQHHQGAACAGRRSRPADERDLRNRQREEGTGSLGSASQQQSGRTRWKQKLQREWGKGTKRHGWCLGYVSPPWETGKGSFPYPERQSWERWRLDGRRVRWEGSVLGDGSFSDFRVGSWAVCGKVLMEKDSI